MGEDIVYILQKYKIHLNIILKQKRRNNIVTIGETISVPITTRNITYYKNKGYSCNCGESLEVKLQDLNPNSTILETRVCDICGKEYERKHNQNINSYSCYGEDVCAECFKNNEDIKQHKIEAQKITFLHLYGETNPMFVSELVAHIGDTMEKRYGVRNASQVEEFKQKQENTMERLYGARKALQIPQFKEKFTATLCDGNNVKTSSQQKACFEMLKAHGYKVEINYPYSYYSLDVLIIMPDNILIDFEYDGLFWHNEKLKNKDAARDKYMKRHRFKIIRIKSDSSVPTWEQIQSQIDFVMQSEENNYTELNIDEIDKKDNI